MTDDLVLEVGHFEPVGRSALAPQSVSVPSVSAPMLPSSAPSAPSFAPSLASPPDAPSTASLRPLSDQVADVERAAIAQALRACGGNRVAASKQLGMSRAALYDRLARWPELGDSGGG